jgi:fumarylacetoacetate (FAA) hydrolase
MKLVSYLKEGNEQLAFLANDLLYDADLLHPELPATMSMFLQYWNDCYPIAQQVNNAIVQGNFSSNKAVPYTDVQILAPVPFATSCRDGYAFRQHVAAARRNRGVEMIKEFDEYPIFYFTNHNSLQGPGDIVCMPDHFKKLDFELEVAIVICKRCR